MEELREKIRQAIESGDKKMIAEISEEVTKEMGIPFISGAYDEYQMIELLRGADAGLDKQEIDMYFHCNIEYLQMIQIRKAIQDGLTKEQVQEIANCKDGWLKMAYMRHMYLAEQIRESEERKDKKQDSFKNHTDLRSIYSYIKEQEGPGDIPIKVEVKGTSLDKVKDGHMEERTKYESTSYIDISAAAISEYFRKLAKDKERQKEPRYKEQEEEVMRNGI